MPLAMRKRHAAVRSIAIPRPPPNDGGPILRQAQDKSGPSRFRSAHRIMAIIQRGPQAPGLRKQPGRFAPPGPSASPRSRFYRTGVL